MFPARYAPVVFGFLLSGMMSCIVSGISTLRVLGFAEGLFQGWMMAWVYGWAIAFPTVLVVAPITRRLVARLVREEAS